MAIPNEEALYGDDIFGRFKAGSQVIKYSLLRKAADYVLKTIDRWNFKEGGIMEASIKKSLQTYLASLRDKRYPTEIHKYGRLMGAIHMPIVGKFLQNIWSLYHLSNGITNIDTVYTIKSGKLEYPFMLHTTNEPSMSVNEVVRKGYEVIGNEKERAEELFADVIRNASMYENKKAVRAGAYGELTDNDIFQISDVGGFPPIFISYELWLLGRHGRRRLVAKNDEIEIYEYKRPPKSSMFRYYMGFDFMYTIYDMAVGTAESVFKGLEKQRLYEEEVKAIAGRIISYERDMRSDGVPNPITKYVAEPLGLGLPSR